MVFWLTLGKCCDLIHQIIKLKESKKELAGDFEAGYMTEIRTAEELYSKSIELVG